MSDIIKIESFSKIFEDPTGHIVQLFEDLSFDIKVGKVNSLLAPKGSGKSTLLKMIAGIDGEKKVTLGNRIIIPQKPSSFPWLNVNENVSFKLKNVDKNELNEAIKFVGLEGYEDHFPNNNSIGFRFRIALARAIFRKPELILIDEPFTKLSFNRKLAIYSLLRKIATEKGITVLITSSSIFEAIRLSDRIILMSHVPCRIVCEKRIRIDEDIRFDESSIFNITDYFTEDEISHLSKGLI